MSAPHPDRCCPTDAPAATCVYHPTGDDFYMAGPLDSKAGIVVVSDIFGMLPNSKRLADMFAQQGYLVIMPDFFEGKAWDHNNFPPDFNSAEWQTFINGARDYDKHMPRLLRAVEVLRKMGCTKVGSIGMCWGSVPSFLASAAGIVDAASTAHPTFFTSEHVKAAKTPILVMPAMDDPPMEDVEAAVKALNVEPHVFKRFDAIPHGFFGARYDPDTYTPEQMEQVSEARQVTLDFFKKALY